MSGRLKIDLFKQTKRWVSYLDLLGFSDLIRSKNWVYVFSHYTKAIELLIKDRGVKPEIDKTWFSDTFLIYSPDDTVSSFLSIELITRWFIYFLIRAGIPVRGAMSCDDFYADTENKIFFGQALIEAYQYGENQNWIGFVLCPSAVNQMNIIGLPATERINYAYWNIPFKCSPVGLSACLPAYIVGGAEGNTSTGNPCLEKLKEMKKRLKDSKHLNKYENTIRFIEVNHRTLLKE